jgi:putative ABC transport system substrate-binding protein
MKKISLFCILLSVLSLALFAQGAPEQPSTSATTKIGISKLLAHPALAVIEQGIQDYLATTGLAVSYDLQNANEISPPQLRFAQKFKSDKKDIVIGIATPSAQASPTCLPIFRRVQRNYRPDGRGLVTLTTSRRTRTSCGVSDLSPGRVQSSAARPYRSKVGGMVNTSLRPTGGMMKLAQQAWTHTARTDHDGGFNSAEVKMAAQTIIDRSSV